MAELMIAQFMPEARVVAQATGNLLERAEHLRELEVEAPAGFTTGAVSQAIHRDGEVAAVLSALQSAQAPPDTNVWLPSADVLRGWYVTDLDPTVHYGHEEGKSGLQEYESDSRPVVLAGKGLLYVCERRAAPDGAEAESQDMAMQHLYIPETASAKGDLAVATGLAVVAVEHGLELAA